MQEDKVRMQNMLQDVVTHFSKNPKELRSIRTGKDRRCLYNPPAEKQKSIGCAIGMYISVKNAKKLDNSADNTISCILNSEKKRAFLPKWIKNMNPNFLGNLQSLHDSDYYWDSDNISEGGKDYVESICRVYGLNYSKIKFKK